MSARILFAAAELTITLVLGSLVSAADPPIEQFSRPAGTAETKLADTLAKGKQLAPAERLDAYRRIAREVLKLEPNNLDVKQTLTKGLDVAERSTSAEEAAATLEAAMNSAAATLAFRPLMEAPLPEGFPPPTPLGQIEIKTYPAYRLAQTKMDGTGDEGRAFFTLFDHITDSSIAMTAPVEMQYESGKQEAVARSMAFLYRSAHIGKLGESGRVEVIDVPAMTVVSLALRGKTSGDRVADAEIKLRDGLAHHGEYEPAGNLRLMGYSSPMVAAERRLAEVQLPVKKRTPPAPNERRP
jgi:hypothetical protein